MDDTKQVRYWGPTNARRHGTKCARPDDWHPRFVHPGWMTCFWDSLIISVDWIWWFIVVLTKNPQLIHVPGPMNPLDILTLKFVSAFLRPVTNGWQKYVSKIKEGRSQRRGQEGTILCIWELPVLRLGEETGCRNWSLSWFPSVPGRYCDVIT